MLPNPIGFLQHMYISMYMYVYGYDTQKLAQPYYVFTSPASTVK